MTEQKNQLDHLSRQRRPSQLVENGEILKSEGIDESHPSFKKLRRKLAERAIGLINAGSKDQLTGLYNRKGAHRKLLDEVERAKRTATDVTLIFLDVNNFKEVNDLHGHKKGDDVLIAIANVLADNSRSIDGLSRWGGDEFLAILPGTDIIGAEKYWEKVKQNFDELKIPGLDGFNVRISAGAVTVNRYDPESSIHNADTAMYEAKEQSKATGHSVLVSFNNG
jgi:diguanylate cyclase (GGDEF)-like protein